MSFVNDHVLDNGLAAVAGSNRRLDICSTEPTTYAQATSTHTLGNKTSITVASASDASPNGRRVTIPAVTDGTVTTAGAAGFWALTDPSNSPLLAFRRPATVPLPPTASPLLASILLAVDLCHHPAQLDAWWDWPSHRAARWHLTPEEAATAADALQRRHAALACAA